MTNPKAEAFIWIYTYIPVLQVLLMKHVQQRVTVCKIGEILDKMQVIEVKSI